jgi:hypothetical protein
VSTGGTIADCQLGDECRNASHQRRRRWRSWWLSMSAREARPLTGRSARSGHVGTLWLRSEILSLPSGGKGSLRAVDAGQQVCAGWTSPVGASAVAALSCCTAAGLCVPKPTSRVSSRSRSTPDRPAIRRLPVFAGVYRWAVPIVTHVVYSARARDRVGTVCQGVSRIWPIAGGHPARHKPCEPRVTPPPTVCHT